MAVPPPLADPNHIETRLLVVAEMLERAVAEVRRALAAVKADATESTDLTLDRPLSGGESVAGDCDG